MRFVKAAQLSDLLADDAVRVEVEGTPVAVVRVRDEVFAVSDVCTHEDTSLAEGFVEGYALECPLHGASFDVRTGEVLALPATRNLPTYPVRVEGDDVLVGIEDQQETT
ncbi:MAG TPA: non-heme iron oxygenase ferredoxin subunit [Actinomycetota bacterium]|nr:non-heme iron oxygenase ferredoxin subunit [Actinomycetota bacterium]